MLTGIGTALLFGLLNGSVYALVGSGLSLTYGKQNLIDVANPAFVVLAAYVVFGINRAFGLDPLLTTPIVITIMFAIGVAVHLLLVRPLLKRPDQDMHLQSALILFGTSLLIQALLVKAFTADFRGLDVPYSNAVVVLAGIRIPVVKLISLALALVSVGGLFAFLHGTFVGRAMLAAYANRDLAELAGINAGRVDVITYGLGAAFAGIAGVVIAVSYSFAPESVVGWMVIAFAVAVIGGKGSTLGILVAGVLVGLVESVTAYTVSPNWLYFAVYLMLLLAFILRPKGLLGERL